MGAGLQLFINQKKAHQVQVFLPLPIEQIGHSEYFQGTVASQERLKQPLAPLLLSSDVCR